VVVAAEAPEEGDGVVARVSHSIGTNQIPANLLLGFVSEGDGR
jgi:hypothetical protein